MEEYKSDDIGDPGEGIARVCFTRITERGSIFRVKHLGEKWPVADFYIELKGNDGGPLFFIAQVKSTKQGMSAVYYSREERNSFAHYYAPTYLIGVDINTEKAFAIFVKSGDKGITGHSLSFELGIENPNLLYDEIRGFWKGSNIRAIKNQFNSITAT